eukprot:840217-Amorphochlora_amoeboformis.AAC.1
MSRPDPTGRAAISVSRLLQRNKGYDYKTGIFSEKILKYLEKNLKIWEKIFGKGGGRWYVSGTRWCACAYLDGIVRMMRVYL